MDTFEKANLRHHLDPESGVLYLSIVDVIEMLGLSTDSRNYWKTLKNRLNKTQNKLVTKCNQLKMRASDGKMYLTDATDEDTMLLLIQNMAPQKVTYFRKIFREMHQKSEFADKSSLPQNGGLSTDEPENTSEDYKLSIDAYEKDDVVFLYAMLAGCEPDDISVVVTTKNILIKGERKQKNIGDVEHITEELGWGKFSREIDFPDEVDIDAVETNFTHGLLQIKISKIDKSRTKIIKVK